MTKTTYKRKDFIKGLLTVSEGEPISIMVRIMAIDMQSKYRCSL